MKLFGSKSRHVLTIDIDHDVLRAGLITPEEDGYAAEFAQFDLQGAILHTGELSNDGDEILASTFEKVVDKWDPSLARVYMTAQDQQTTLSYQSFPPIKGKALTDVVKNRVMEVIRGIEEDNIRFGFVETARSDTAAEGIVAATKRHVAEQYANVLRQFDASIIRMEPQVFSLLNLVKRTGIPPELNERVIVLAHMTYARLNLAVLHKGKLLFARLGSAGENIVRSRNAYKLLTDELKATLESYRPRSSQPPIVLFTGRMTQDEKARQAIVDADTVLLDGLSSIGVLVNGEGAPDEHAALLGLASWEAPK